MKKMIKIFIQVLFIIGLLSIGFIMGHMQRSSYEEASNTIEVVEVEYKPNGAIIEVYNNGSYSYIDEINNIYKFTAMEFGDWSHEVSSREDLENLVNTYKSIKQYGYY